MSKRVKTPLKLKRSIATDSLPRPSDFPTGSVQSRAAARAIVEAHIAEEHRAEEAEYQNLTEFELAMCERYTGLKKRVALGMARACELRAEIFQSALPSPAEIRRGLAIGAEIDRMTNGLGLYLNQRDQEEWNRLKAIAEENLKLSRE